MDTNTPDLLFATGGRALDVRGSLDILVCATDRMLLVVENVEVNAERGQSVGQRGDGTWTNTSDRMLDAIDLDDTGETTLEVLGVERFAGLRRRGRGRPVSGDVVVDQVEAGVGLEVVLLLEEVHNFLGPQLPAGCFGCFLDDPTELNLQTTGEIQLQSPQNNPGGTTLTALGVDTDDRLVVPSDILRVERQIRNLPFGLVVSLGILAQLEALLDGILVTATECTDDELTTIWPSLVDRDLVALLDQLDDRVEIRKVHVGSDSLGVKVQRKGNEVNIACSLAISKQSSLHTLSTSHLCQLSRRNGAATVVVRMYRNYKLSSLGHMRAEVFDLIGKDIRGSHLDRRGKVEDDRVFLGRFPGRLDSLADFGRELRLRIGEGLGREFKLPFSAGHGRVILGDGARELGAAHGHLQTLFLVLVEHDATEAFAGGQVDVQNGLLCAPKGFNSTADNVLPARGQDLQPDIIRCHTGGIDEATSKVEVCLRGGREGNLDLFVPDLDELLEETEFLLPVLQPSVSFQYYSNRRWIYHWIRQTLVTISQVGGQPAGSLFDNLIRPLTVGKVEGLEALVLLGGIFEPVDS